MVAIILAAAVVRAYQIGRESLWYDELYAVWASRLPLSNLFAEVVASRHPPLYFLILHFILMIGSGDVWFRALSVIAGVLSVWLIYLIGKALYSRQIGLWAAAFAALSPMLIWYSREATCYSFLTTLSLLSLLFLIRWLEKGGWKDLTLYTVMTVLAVATHFFAVMLLPAGLAFWWIIGQRRKISKQGAITVVVLGVFVLLAAIVAIVKAGPTMVNIAPLNIFKMKLVSGLNKASVVVAGGPKLSSYSKMKLVMYPFLALASLGAATIAWRPFRERLSNRKTLALATYTFLIVIGPIILHAMLDDINESFRFYSWAAAPFFLLLAALLATIPRKPQVLLGCPIIIWLAVFGAMPVIAEPKWELRSIVNTISENQQEGDAMVCFPLQHCVVAAGAYAQKTPPLTGGFINNGAVNYSPQLRWEGYLSGYNQVEKPNDETELKRMFDHSLAGSKRLWLVIGDGSTIDYENSLEVKQSLSEEWSLKQEWEHSPVDLFLFERK